MNTHTITAQPKTSSRARIADWLNKSFGLSIAEDDPALFSKARAFGSQAYAADDAVASGNGFIRRTGGQTDPIIASLIRQAENEEREARETRDERQHHQVERRAVKAALAQQHTADFWQENATYIYGCIGNWFEENFGEYFAAHYAGNLEALIEAIGEVQATRSKEMDERTDELIKPLEQRIGEVEALHRTREQADIKRNTEFMQQVTERLDKRESMDAAVVKHVLGDLKQSWTNYARTIDQRLDELEATEAKHNTELVQTIDKALAHIEKLNTRIDEFETAFWRREEGDNKRLAELAQQTNQKIAALESQVSDAWREVADARRDLTEGSKRLGELEAAFWEKLEGLERRNSAWIDKAADKTAMLEGELADARREVADTKRELVEGAIKAQEHLGELEDAFWGKRESDDARNAELADKATEKIATLERELADARGELADTKRELVIIRQEIKVATDVNERFRLLEREMVARQNTPSQSELLDRTAALEREIADLERTASFEAKFQMLAERHRGAIKQGDRGERGLQGPQGERGPAGPAGKAGRNGETKIITRIVDIKSWEVSRRHYAVAPVLSDGSTGAVLPLRELFEQFQQEVG